MKNKAIFLDRDGTINVDKHYLHKIEDFEFIPGTLEGLKLLYDAGYMLILITNQSGIGRGYFTEDEYKVLEAWLEERLQKNGSPLTASYYCPHLPDAKIEKYRLDCECRKPKLGMYERAIKDWNIDVGNSYAIGDRLRDCSICEKTDCQGFLVGSTEDKEVIDKVKAGKVKSVSYATDLYTTAREIVKK
jgi:D-glycero-D-manno-heptose 1,7-bisphosphate phosphatase